MVDENTVIRGTQEPNPGLPREPCFGIHTNPVFVVTLKNRMTMNNENPLYLHLLQFKGFRLVQFLINI